jgi:hypothetical protein
VRIHVNRAVFCGLFLTWAARSAAQEYVREGSDNPIAMAAYEFVERPFEYDFTMGFYRTTYRDSVNTGRFVFPGGDIDPSIGVCTDLVVRTFRKIGLDLQELVHEDATRAFSAYPYGIWNMTRPDANIDHRRVPMLDAFFRRNGKTLTTDTSPDRIDEWKAGDIVVWDLTNNGRLDHIGIVSDIRLKDSRRPLVIDNFPDPGHVAIGDILNQWTIKAHYRYP